jgi:hypothetical protein
MTKESERTMKHKHAELIKAWADGAKIQLLHTNHPQHWEDIENPFWYPCAVYRIKPEPKPDTHNHYRFSIHTRTLTEVLPGERGDLWVTICGETGKLKSAKVL